MNEFQIRSHGLVAQRLAYIKPPHNYMVCPTPTPYVDAHRIQRKGCGKGAEFLASLDHQHHIIALMMFVSLGARRFGSVSPLPYY